jgi:hypothetical protein
MDLSGVSILLTMYALNHLVISGLIVLILRERRLAHLKVESLRSELFEQYRRNLSGKDAELSKQLQLLLEITLEQQKQKEEKQ